MANPRLRPAHLPNLSVLNTTQREVGIHVLTWLVVASMWWSLFYFDFKDPLITARFILFLLIQQMLTTYLSIYYFIPVLLYPRRYVQFGLLYGGMLLLMGFVNTQWFSLVLQGVPRLLDEYTQPSAIISYGVLMNLFVNSLAGLARVGYDRLQSETRSSELEKEKVELEKQKVELEKEKAETELRFLKAQINPHFLFNSLNSIFNLIDKDPRQARDLLIVFSEMLRYQLYETDSERVVLTTELEYIRSYIRMEQVRKGGSLEVTFRVDEPLGYLEVPPLILLTFVENAFKHVSTHYTKPNWVRIELRQRPGNLQFEVRNSKADVGLLTPFVSTTRTGGIGLSNVQRRLSLIYPERHRLVIDDQPETYTVQLTLISHAD